MKLYLSIIFSLLAALNLSAQNSENSIDNIAWVNSALKVPFSDKSTFTIKPIIRYNNDFSTLQNSSLDYNISRKLNNGFSLTFHGRTWFLQKEDRIRQFIWTDLNHSYKKNKWSLLNKLRHHWALDVRERADSDFIRYLIKYSYALSPNIKVAVGAEPWLRLNDFNQLQRARYHAGLSYKLNSSFSVALNYWREQNWNGLAGNRSFNVWLPGLVYTGSLDRM